MIHDNKHSENGVATRMTFLAKVRRRFLRSRRQVVFSPPSTIVENEPPIFLIGVHRSGTTLLRLILDSHSRIACPTESIFLLPLSSLWRDSKAMSGLQAMGFEESHVVEKLREFSSYYFSAYASSRSKARWADKSPHYIDCLDFIEQLYGPRCQYIFIYRNGLDVACSVAERVIRQAEEMKKACGDPYVGGARYWAEQCKKMRDFQSAHSERIFEVRYETLAMNPEPICQAMFQFLGEEWQNQVLQFYKQKHDSHPALEDPLAATSKGFTPSVANYKKLSKPVLMRMMVEAGDVLQDLGYDTF